MKKFLIENNTIIRGVVLDSVNEAEKYPATEGWKDEEKPDVDYDTQIIGEPYYDAGSDIVKYTIEEKELDLTKIKQQHYQEVTDTIKEISGIISTVKNVYDPLRDMPENIPAEFVTLVRQVQTLRQRAYDEIEILSTPEEALNYVVRGPEVEGYINQLKSFIQ